MRLTASDFMMYWRPSPCELRVFLQEKGEPQAEPLPFEEVMQRLGLRDAQSEFVRAFVQPAIVVKKVLQSAKVVLCGGGPGQLALYLEDDRVV